MAVKDFKAPLTAKLKGLSAAAVSGHIVLHTHTQPHPTPPQTPHHTHTPKHTPNQHRKPPRTHTHTHTHTHTQTHTHTHKPTRLRCCSTLEPRDMRHLWEKQNERDVGV